MTPHPLLAEIPWETRNLGVLSYALSATALVESGGSALAVALQEAAEAHGDIFVQAKIDQAHASLSQLLGAVGFYFVEVALTPHLSLRNHAPLALFERDPDTFLRGRFEPGEIHVGPIDQGNASQLIAIRDIAGTSFRNDRFHLDPNCEPKVAHKRYQRWVDQMLADKDHQFYIMTYGGQVMAFMVRCGTTLPLAGFAQAYTRSGLGEYFWLSILLAMREQGLSQVSTGISTNNTAVLNLYARLGFRLRHPTAVFHYWSKSIIQGA